jgi:hygromycin-B 7''-O-kinase
LLWIEFDTISLPMDISALSTRLNVLQTLDGYRKYFMDANIWQPVILALCTRHGLPCETVKPGLAGSFPTFIIDNHWVIKFFGQLFDGHHSFRVEQRMGELLSHQTHIPAAKVHWTGAFAGSSFDWLYIIFDYVPGKSIGEDYDRIAFNDKVKLARHLGKIICSFHHIPLQYVKLQGFTLTRETYNSRLREWFKGRLLKGEIGLPQPLSAQAVDYLVKVDQPILFNTTPHLIHADLTRDHILGHFTGDHWELLAVIDFGDAMPGDIFYELAALHLDAFDCDKRLLAAFLESYGLDESDRINFEEKCMAAALQHQFDIFSPLFARFPRLQQVESLAEMAGLLWDIHTPGVRGI